MIDADPGQDHPTDARAQPRKSAAAFRTISEVAADLDLPQHVLRFWETKFTHVRPMKRGGGRRYYRPEDVALLREIKGLLYDDGYTIKGVQKLLRDKGGAKGLLQDAAAKPHTEPEEATAAVAASRASGVAREELEAILGELQDIRRMLAAEET